MPVRKAKRIARWLGPGGRLLWATIGKCMRDDTPQMAAALSFYSLLSLGPALWIIIAAAGAIVGPEIARQRIVSWSVEFMGSGAASFVNMVVARSEGTTPLATTIGIVTLFFGATLAFGTLYDSLNRIWNVQAPEHKMGGLIRSFLTKRLLAFLMIGLIGLLVLASLMFSTVIRLIGDFFPASLPAPSLLLQTANFAVSLLLVMVLFAAIYRLLHDAEIHCHDVWVGAAVTALLFEFGKTLVTIILGNYALTNLAGTAGSLAALLLWVYYSAQILLFGAEFTELYSKLRQSVPHPEARVKH